MTSIPVIKLLLWRVKTSDSITVVTNAQGKYSSEPIKLQKNSSNHVIALREICLESQKRIAVTPCLSYDYTIRFIGYDSIPTR